MINAPCTAEFWNIVEAAFIRPRNLTFDRHVFLITKQLRDETAEHFYGNLKEIPEICEFEKKEETLIRDVFIPDLFDPDIQKELLKQTVELRQALELAINMELGMQNQHKIQQHKKTLIILFSHDHQIGHSRTLSRSRTIDLHYIAQFVVRTGYQIIAINESVRAKLVIIAG